MLAYLAFLAGNALASRRKASDISGYYVANRRLGGVAVGLSFFATFASTNSYIGHAGKGYEYGLPWMTMAFMLILFTVLSWKIVGPKTRELAASFDALTMPDFFGGVDLTTREAQAFLKSRQRLSSFFAVFFI